jgi:MATE family multidrug resistance protein
VVGVACFQLDGIFIGATRTVDMRNMMIVSLAVYLAVWWALTPLIGNHGLWASIHAFFVIRAITLASRYPALVRVAFASEN